MTAKTPPKPGRKPTAPTPAAPVVIDGAEAFDRLGESAVALATHDATGADRDLANQMFGQIQMGMAIAKFTDVVSLQKLKHIKETKMYRALSGQKGVDRDGGEIADVGTFDGFCRALGTSASKVDEDLKNLAVFGEEALAQLTQAGAGYRELRQYRRLPDDHKLALIEAAKGGDKSDFLDLAEELITRHAREKEAQQRQLDDAAGKVAARDKLIAAKDEKINDLSLKAERFGAPGDEGRAAITEQLGALTAEAVQIVQGAMRLGFAQLVQAHGGMAHAPRDLMAGLVGQLRRELLLLQEEFGLPELVGDGKPEWLHGAEAMEAEDAAQARKKAPKTAH